MKLFATLFFLAIGVVGLAHNNGNAALFGLIGLIVTYGLTVIRYSYLKSKGRYTGFLPLFFLLFGADTHAQVAPATSLSAPKFERHYSYLESRDKGDPVTYSFTIETTIISNGEMLKIVVGDEADLMPIVGYGKDADGFDYVDTEIYRLIVRPNDILRIWGFSQKSHDRFAYPKI